MVVRVPEKCKYAGQKTKNMRLVEGNLAVVQVVADGLVPHVLRKGKLGPGSQA